MIKLTGLMANVFPKPAPRAAAPAVPGQPAPTWAQDAYAPRPDGKAVASRALEVGMRALQGAMLTWEGRVQRFEERARTAPAGQRSTAVAELAEVREGADNARAALRLAERITAHPKAMAADHREAARIIAGGGDFNALAIAEAGTQLTALLVTIERRGAQK